MSELQRTLDGLPTSTRQNVCPKICLSSARNRAGAQLVQGVSKAPFLMPMEVLVRLAIGLLALAMALPALAAPHEERVVAPTRWHAQLVADRRASDPMGEIAGLPARSVTDFGAKCDGSTDDTAAFQRAAAALKNEALYIPEGRTCVIASGSITLNAALFSFPGSATLKFPHDFGAGKAGLYLQAEAAENINLVGPGGRTFPGVGKSLAKMNGLQIGTDPNVAPQPFLRGLNVQGFYSGVVYNTNYGHIHLADSVITNNYYGIYLLANAGDTKIYDSEITGQGMAGIACPANSHCLDGGCIISGTHLGFSPYGIYQEPGASESDGFISDCLLEQVRFESIGNAALRSAATGNRHLQPSLDTTYIIHPGFGWDSRYAIKAGPTYAIDVPYLSGQLRVDQGVFPFSPGSSGVMIHAQNCTGRVVLNYDGPTEPPPGSPSSPAPLLVVDNPQNQGCVWASRVRTASLSPSGLIPYLDISIPSGQTSARLTIVTSSYAMDPKGIQPICAPAGDAGSRWWITVEPLGNRTAIDLHLSVAATHETSFYCHLTDQG
jgi:Pectate lyase superfamily protein